MKKISLFLALIFALSLLAACGQTGTFIVDSREETGGTDVTAENAGKGTSALGYVTIGEGECLVISPDLSQGSLTVRASLMEREATVNDLGTADELSLEETIEGRVMTAYYLEPGEYAVGITCAEKTTGTASIMPCSIEELEQQDAALAEAIAAAMAAEPVTDDIYLTLVNKTHKLPDNWEDKIELLEMKNAYDEDIRAEKGSHEAFLRLREALLKEGVDIELDSCYRSVVRQEELWDEFEEEYGIAYCRQYVAVPGFSEHHTGFAVDVCLKKDGKLIYDNDEMMKETAIWEKVHEKMPEYGFILRYMEGKEDITGYSYEPWHMRYVGDPEIAKTITGKGLTLEEYLGQVEPADVTVDYGASTLYTRDEMNAAISLIRDEFSTWEGCELHSISYTGDACNSAENIKWVNEIKPGKHYTQCIEFLSDFHSPVEGGDAWEPDQEYTDWQWWLARTDSGDWALVSWGY